ncbi:MAG: hypothetical protein WCX64_01695 [Candidatus Micrarchaeia archaeon]
MRRRNRAVVLTGGIEARPYFLKNHVLKVVSPSEIPDSVIDAPDEPSNDRTASFRGLSAAEQTTRVLGLFMREHPNMARVHYVLPFWSKDHRGGFPKLLVIQDRIRPNCAQPKSTVEMTGLWEHKVTRDKLEIDPQIMNTIYDIRLEQKDANGQPANRYTLVDYRKGKPVFREDKPNLLRIRRAGKTQDVLIDALLKDEAMVGQVRKKETEAWPGKKPCAETGTCDADWKKFVNNSKEGFGRIPRQITLSQLRSIHEIRPLLPMLKKKIASDRRAKRAP